MIPFFSRRAMETRSLRPRPRLTLESLEGRDVPSVMLPEPGKSGPAVLTGTTGADQFVVRSAPTMGILPSFQFSDDGGKSFHTAHQRSITEIVVQGRFGNDRLTIDHRFGFVAKAEGLPISYQAGYGYGREFDELVVTGDPGAGVQESYSVIGNRGEGMLQSTNGFLTHTIKFSPLASILDTMAAESLTIHGTSGADAIQILDGARLDGLTTTRVVVAAPAAPIWATPFSIDVANKPLMNVDAGAGDDVITINNPIGATGLRSLGILGILGGAGIDGFIPLQTPFDVALWHDSIEWIREEK